eukprot:m.45674 g.45674  ORF g.45674 m.45674 type:complete len:79 (+) comp8667_c0_seq1:651-887(+)
MRCTCYNGAFLRAVVIDKIGSVGCTRRSRKVWAFLHPCVWPVHKPRLAVDKDRALVFFGKLGVLNLCEEVQHIGINDN